MTRYPTIDEVTAIHAKLITRFGGSVGTRDRGALEAAALWESLSHNHPFVDGNKRVAVTVAAAFLRVNGYRLELEDNDAFSFLTGLYETGRVRFEELDGWLRRHVVPGSPPG